MSEKELQEKASDQVGGGATGGSKSADPVATGNAHANRSADKDQGDKASQKVAGAVEDTDAENNTKPTGDASAKNKATIATKPSAASASVKEEINGLFGDELSEEFKEKATVIFEAAIAGQIAEHRTALEEEFEAKKTELEESFQKAREELVEEVSNQVSDYLDYVVEQWMEENKVAIESSLNAQIAQEFMGKLKDLFVESYIQIPEDKVDVVEELAAKLEEMEEKVNGVVAENIELQKQIDSKDQAEVFASVSEGLALTQVEKFKALAEGVSYEDAESYGKKLALVKEQYFGEKKVSQPAQTIVEQEQIELDEETQPQTKVAGPVSNYVNAISRTIKK